MQRTACVERNQSVINFIDRVQVYLFIHIYGFHLKLLVFLCSLLPSFFAPLIWNSFSGLVGALGSGFGTLGGYNGLPSVLSGLDDSLSDVVQRKKYPFELEKAIHNVMFIQHHIQRQDEFNAVSTLVYIAYIFVVLLKCYFLFPYTNIYTQYM